MEKSGDKTKEAAKKWQAQLDRQNEYNKNNYDRMGIVVSKGVKDIILNEIQKKGYNKFNAYALDVISKDLQLDISKDLQTVQNEIAKRNSINPDDDLPFK